MRTITTKTTVYKFDELSPKGQEKAIELLYDINVDHDWWDGIYMEAEDLGFKITEFDTDRASYCKIDIVQDETEIAGNIIKSHGKHCATYKLAKTFLAERDEIVNTAPKDENGEFEDVYKLDDKLDDIEADFLKDLSGEYLSLLREACEYLTSVEAIKETIESNDYEFTADGRLY